MHASAHMREMNICTGINDLHPLASQTLFQLMWRLRGLFGTIITYQEIKKLSVFAFSVAYYYVFDFNSFGLGVPKSCDQC